jgi:hypothetical protein
MKIVAAAGAALFVLSLHAQSLTASLPVPEASDGYHLLYWLGSGRLADYNEWWYFNFYDTTNNIQAIFTYQIANPLNVSGLGISELSTAVYSSGGILVDGSAYFTPAFSASPLKANVTIGKPNAITVIDDNTYQITGATRDGKVSWNLLYQRTAPSWFAFSRLNVSSEPWELMSWLPYMPAAAVSGTLTVNGTTYQVNATGYHDHNWGEWNFETVPWNWAQVSQSNLTPALTFDLGDFPDEQDGVASVEVNGERYVFQHSQYTLIHTQWATDPTFNVEYPTQSKFTANNGTAQITLTMNVIANQGLSTASSPPELVIFEQTAAYTGEVTVGSTVTNISSNGFKEYATIVQ